MTRLRCRKTGKRQRRRSGLRGFHSCEESSLGMSSHGESFPVSYVCFLGSASQGNRAMDYKLIPFLWEKDWSKGVLWC